MGSEKRERFPGRKETRKKESADRVEIKLENCEFFMDRVRLEVIYVFLPRRYIGRIKRSWLYLLMF